MTYLVEIVYKNALTPAYQYYNTFSEITQMILECNNIEYVEVYKLDKEKTKNIQKTIKKKHN